MIPALSVVAAVSAVLVLAALFWRPQVLVNLLVSSLLIALSLYILLESSGMVHEIYSAEAFLIPAVLAGLLLLSAGLEYSREWQHAAKVLRSAHIRILFIVMAVSMAYLLLLPYLGYYLSTLLFMCCISFSMGNRSRLSMSLMSMAWLGVAYIIFERTLKIPLPEFSIFGG